MKYEWKKNEKEIYLPKEEAVLVEIPEYSYFVIEGKGNPNDAFFSECVGCLYSLSYGLKMMPKKGIVPAGYFDYAIYPLEGIWSLSEAGVREKGNTNSLIKEELLFKLMIRQPSFCTEEVAKEVLEITKKKKPHPLLEQVRFEKIEEGNTVQILHIGPYDDEPRSFKKLDEFCERTGLKRKSMFHKEIYISDARKVLPSKRKTVLRYAVEVRWEN